MIFKNKKDKSHASHRAQPHHEAVAAHLEKELAAHKPHVRMDESFPTRLKNELLHEFSKKYSVKSERAGMPFFEKLFPFLRKLPGRIEKDVIRPVAGEIPVIRGFFARNWVKGLVGVLAVMVVSAATLYVNRYQFLSMLVPSESQGPVLSDEFAKSRLENKPNVTRAKKEETAVNAQSETAKKFSPRAEETEAPMSRDKNGPSGEMKDDKAASDLATRSSPAPEQKMDNTLAFENREAAKEKKSLAADENISAGASITEKQQEAVEVTLEYRFGGRPAAFDEIEKLVSQGMIPGKSAVKMDDMVNTFLYEDRERSKDPLSVVTETAECPWNQDSILLLVTVRAGSFDTNTTAIDNASLRVRYTGQPPEGELPKGSYFFIPVHSRDNAASSISGTYLPGDRSIILIEIPSSGQYTGGQILARGELSYRKNGEKNSRTIPFSVPYSAKPGLPSTDQFRMAAAMMYWGNILIGRIPDGPAHFSKILALLQRVAENIPDPGRTRLAESVRLSQLLMEK